RDDIPRIFYPGHWGCFGGAVAPGEGKVEALRRELAEELEFDAPAVDEFVTFDFDLSKLGQKKCYRTYYEIKTTAAEVGRFILHEGADMRLLATNEVLAQPNVTPYDSFAIWLHVARARFVAAA
ncbi:MAG: NUDIX domain-containing protein, partial [Xanthobacteraceae bacterium]